MLEASFSSPLYIQTQDDLVAYCQTLRESGRFGFDTEFISERNYRPRVCLVQVASAAGVALIDPLAGLDLAPFWELVLDPDLEVITHAGQADYLLCYRQTGALPQRGFDIQLAAGFVGFGYPLGYAALARALLRIGLDKRERLTDWAVRPLRPAQQRYAVEDVAYLLPMADRLQAKLDQRGRRAWVDEEFERLRRAELCKFDASERFREVRGAGSLGAESLAVLRELYQWREQQAEERDRPARSVMPDHILIELAKRKPQTEDQARQVRGLHDGHLGRRLPELLQAVARGLAVLPAQRPRPAVRREMSPHLLPVVDIARAVLRLENDVLDIDNGLLCTRADLERFIDCFYHDPAQLERDPLNTGWRRACVGRLLERLLSGSTALRLVRREGRPRLEVLNGEADCGL